MDEGDVSLAGLCPPALNFGGSGGTPRSSRRPDPRGPLCGLIELRHDVAAQGTSCSLSALACGYDAAMRFIGMDLAWVPRHRTGLAVAIDGHVGDSTTVVTDDDICDWLEPHLHGPALIAVDAPLIVRNPAGTSRRCDRAITSVFGSNHAGAHSANLGIASFAAGVRAERLAVRLGLGTDPVLVPGQPLRRMIEVYPHPAMVSLFGLRFTLKYKAKRGRDLSSRRTAFAELVRHLTTLDSTEPRMEVRSAPRWRLLCDVVATGQSARELDVAEDELDAFMCAYIGFYYWRHGTDRCRIVGDLDSGYIVTPVTQELGDRIDRLVLRDVPVAASLTAGDRGRSAPRTSWGKLGPSVIAAASVAGDAQCACGCGAAVRRRYLPGHDARHKEALIRRALQGDTTAEVTLARLGWTRFLEARRRT